MKSELNLPHKLTGTNEIKASEKDPIFSLCPQTAMALASGLQAVFSEYITALRSAGMTSDSLDEDEDEQMLQEGVSQIETLFENLKAKNTTVLAGPGTGETYLFSFEPREAKQRVPEPEPQTIILAGDEWRAISSALQDRINNAIAIIGVWQLMPVERQQKIAPTIGEMTAKSKEILLTPHITIQIAENGLASLKPGLHSS